MQIDRRGGMQAPSANAAEHHESFHPSHIDYGKDDSNHVERIKTMRRKLGNLQHKLGNSPCHISVRSIVKDNTAEKIETAEPLMDLSECSPYPCRVLSCACSF